MSCDGRQMERASHRAKLTILNRRKGVWVERAPKRMRQPAKQVSTNRFEKARLHRWRKNSLLPKPCQDRSSQAAGNVKEGLFCKTGAALAAPTSPSFLS